MPFFGTHIGAGETFLVFLRRKTKVAAAQRITGSAPFFHDWPGLQVARRQIHERMVIPPRFFRAASFAFLSSTRSSFSGGDYTIYMVLHADNSIMVEKRRWLTRCFNTEAKIEFHRWYFLRETLVSRAYVNFSTWNSTFGVRYACYGTVVTQLEIIST